MGDDEVIGAFGVARESSSRQSRGSWVGPGLGELAEGGHISRILGEEED